MNSLTLRSKTIYKTLHDAPLKIPHYFSSYLLLSSFLSLIIRFSLLNRRLLGPVSSEPIRAERNPFAFVTEAQMLQFRGHLFTVKLIAQFLAALKTDLCGEKKTNHQGHIFAKISAANTSHEAESLSNSAVRVLPRHFRHSR